ISDGIIAEALATGVTIVTQSAFSDPRFNARESIQVNQIEAVLCAPVGEDPPCGALYLQGPSNSDVFSTDGRLRAETFARHLAPVVRRVLAKRRTTGARWRANVSARSRPSVENTSLLDGP